MCVSMSRIPIWVDHVRYLHDAYTAFETLDAEFYQFRVCYTSHLLFFRIVGARFTGQTMCIKVILLLRKKNVWYLFFCLGQLQ